MTTEHNANKSIIKRVVYIFLKIIYYIIIFYVGMYLVTVTGVYSNREKATHSYPFKCIKCSKGFYETNELWVNYGNGSGICVDCLAADSKKQFFESIQKANKP